MFFLFYSLKNVTPRASVSSKFYRGQCFYVFLRARLNKIVHAPIEHHIITLSVYFYIFLITFYLNKMGICVLVILFFFVRGSVTWGKEREAPQARF